MNLKYIDPSLPVTATAVVPVGANPVVVPPHQMEEENNPDEVDLDLFWAECALCGKWRTIKQQLTDDEPYECTFPVSCVVKRCRDKLEPGA